MHKPGRSQLLLSAFAIATLFSIAATYYNTIVLRDFVIIDDLDEAEYEE